MSRTPVLAAVAACLAASTAASQAGCSFHDYLGRGPTVRLVSDDEKVPARDGAGLFEMISPAETIQRQIVSRVVFFEPLNRI